MKPYGCHSKPRKDGYYAMQRILHPIGPPEYGWIWIKDTMTKQCNYRQTTPNDKRCEGCTCE